MPKKIDGRVLSRKEHRQWKHVYSKTGSGSKATAAVKKGRRGKR